MRITSIGGSREGCPSSEDEAEIVRGEGEAGGQEEGEVVGDLSLQIGTKETFPNRM